MHLININGKTKLSWEKTRYIRVDRGCRIYAYEADKENKLERRE